MSEQTPEPEPVPQPPDPPEEDLILHTSSYDVEDLPTRRSVEPVREVPPDDPNAIAPPEPEPQTAQMPVPEAENWRFEEPTSATFDDES